MAENLQDIAAKYGATISTETVKPTEDLQSIAAKYGATLETPATPVTEPEHETDVGGAIGRGLKSLAPWLLKKEDLQHKGNIAETAIEVGTGIVGDIATNAALGAAAGALAGSAVPGLGTAVGLGAGLVLGAVRGFGYEYAKSSAEGKDFNPVKGTINTLAEINPLVSKGSRLIKAATQALLEVGRSAQYNQGAANAAVAGVVGGTLAGVFHKNTGKWLAMVGEPASRPGSKTQTPSLTETQMQGTLNLFNDKSEFRLGSLIENNINDKRAKIPDYFTLGDKLDSATKLEQLAKQPGVKLKPKAEELIADIGSFKKWYLNQPGARVADGEVQGSFEHYLKTRGKEHMDEAFNNYKEQQEALRIVDVVNKKIAQDLMYKSTETGHMFLAKKPKGDTKVEVPDATYKVMDKPIDPLQDSWVEKLQDAKYVMRKIDDSTGLNLEGMLDAFSAAKNKHSTMMMGYLEQANALVGKARKNKIDMNKIGQWLALDDINNQRAFEHKAPLDIKLNKVESDIAEGWRKLFEDARLQFKNQGLNIDFLNKKSYEAGGRYLPMTSKSGHEATAALRKEIKTVGDKLDSIESIELRRTVARILNKADDLKLEPKDIKYKSQLDQAMKYALDPNKSKGLLGFESAAAHQRTPGLGAPEFIRDFDVGKLFVNYINNNGKTIFYEDAFAQAATELAIVRKLGYANAANYIDTYLKNISGTQSNFLSGITRLTNKHKDTMEKILEGIDDKAFASKFQQGAVRALRDMPEFASFAISSIYPNFLGGNLRAAVRNYAQPFLLTAPELGWGYGGKLVAKATAAAAADKMSGGVDIMAALRAKGLDKLDPFVNKLESTLHAKNMIAGKHLGIAGDITSTGLRSHKLVGAAVEKLDKFNDLAMGLYSMSDATNRYITLKVAQQLTTDLKAGNKRALDYVMRTMSEGNKAAFRRIGIKTLDDLRNADHETIADLLANQLISKTQFNYGKEQMNEFGRHFGRLSSMFTKWPAMIMSDGGELLRKHGLGEGSIKILQRYLAPLAALSLTSGYLMDTEKNPKVRYILGDNLGDWSPVMAVKVGAPPVIKSAYDLGQFLLGDMTDSGTSAKQKKEKALKFVEKQARAYIPGMSVVNELGRINKAFNPEE